MVSYQRDAGGYVSGVALKKESYPGSIEMGRINRTWRIASVHKAVPSITQFGALFPDVGSRFFRTLS
jgi:hypothetical protein